MNADRETESVTKTRANGLVALSGFLAGGGVACKYPALLFLVVPLFVFILLRRLSHRDGASSRSDAKDDDRSKRAVSTRRWAFDVRAATIFSIAVVLGCGLWFGKNIALSGNPTYPLLYRWFDGKSWTPEKDAQWRHAHGPPYGGTLEAYSPREFWNNTLLLALRSDYLSPALWPLAVFGLLSLRHCWPLRLLLGMMLWTTVMWWLLTHRVDRFLVPILPFAAIFAGMGATWGRNRVWVWVVTALLTWNGAYCFVFDTLPLLISDGRFFLSLHELRTDVPRGPEDITRFHQAHRYLNEHVQPGYQALLVGEAQVFDLEIPILYNTCFDDCNLETLMGNRSRDERLAALREKRISHVFVYWRELDRYRSPGNYGYSDFATRALVRKELVAEQGLLKPVPLDLQPDNGEVLEVVGWKEWEKKDE